MVDEDYDFIFKILLLGDSDVGKSSLLLRYVDAVWNESFVPTIGVDFKVKTIDIGDKKLKMQIWDTAGQERFRNVVSTYFRGSNGILLLYDITNRESFKDLESWLIEIEKNADENVLKILIGNKNDLEEERAISYDEGKAFADRNNMQFIETSAKLDTNVSEAFETLGKLMVELKSSPKPLLSNKNENKKLNASAGKDLNTKKKVVVNI